MLKRHTYNACLVMGAAVYWAASIINRFDNYTSSGTIPSQFPDFGSLFISPSPLIIVLLVALATAQSSLFVAPRVRTVVASIIVFCGLAVAFLSPFFEPVLGSIIPYPLLMTALLSVETGGLVLLWGFAFASLDKKAAGQTVMLTALMAVLLYFFITFVLLTFLNVPKTMATSLLFSFSALFFLLNKIPFIDQLRTPKSGQVFSKMQFVASRSAIGLILGLLKGSKLAFSLRPSELLLFVGIILISGIILFSIFSKKQLYYALPILPLLIVGLLFLPFSANGLSALTCFPSAIIWFTWICMSSFQLSELKESYGISEARLCFAEKTIVVLAWTIGDFIAKQIHSNLGLTIWTNSTVETIVATLTYGVVIFATYTIFRLIFSRKEAELQDSRGLSREEARSRIYDQIAREYGLSAREREVFDMLAQGYSRTHIMNRLIVSDGTAKSHIAHIYQKLDIHKKDDLLILIKEHEKT